MFAYTTRPLGYSIDSPPPDTQRTIFTADGATLVDSALDVPIRWIEGRVGAPVQAIYETSAEAWPRPSGGTVNIEAGGTATLGLALAPVDCGGYSPTGPATFVFIAQAMWTAPAP